MTTNITRLQPLNVSQGIKVGVKASSVEILNKKIDHLHAQHCKRMFPKKMDIYLCSQLDLHVKPQKKLNTYWCINITSISPVSRT